VIDRLEENIRRFKGSTEKMAKVARSMETRVERLKRELVEMQKSGKKVKVRFPQPEPSGRVPWLQPAWPRPLVTMLCSSMSSSPSSGASECSWWGSTGPARPPSCGSSPVWRRRTWGMSFGPKATLGYYAQEHEQISTG
jgi:hypothetical protein